MNLADPRFVADLHAALRVAMAEALRHFRSLAHVDVTGVERTLYPILRDTALRYLESVGYFYLTRHPNFFVIGETLVKGTKRRADGFICNPDEGMPVYALEIGVGGEDKFWDDYRKSIDEWSRTGILAVFILLFENSGAGASLYRLDSACLRTPRNDRFAIYPLILPLDPSFEGAMLSLTCYEYFERHRQMTLRMVTISDRSPTEVRRWTTDVIAPVLENCERVLVNKVFSTGAIDTRTLASILDDERPLLVVLQGGKSPLSGFDDTMRERLRVYFATQKPVLVLFGDWLERTEWEGDSLIKQWLPVEIVGENHNEGKWDYFGNRPRFGQEIVPGHHPWLDLSGISDPQYSIGGFVRVRTKQDETHHVDLEVRMGDNEAHPLVVSDRERRVVWVGSGTGGWGSNWYGKYLDGCQLLWREVLTKSGLVPDAA